MFNLIIKDLLVLKKVFFLGLLYIPLLMIAFGYSGGAMASVGIIGFTYILVTSSCANDDKYSVDILMNCLPINRSTVVTSKYLTVVFYTFVGFLIYVFFSWLIPFLGLPFRIAEVNLEAIITTLLAVVIMTSILLPLFFKYGYIKSKVFNFILFFAFFFGAALVESAIKNNYDTNPLLNELINTFANQSGALIMLETIALMLFIFIASWLISIRAYAKREF